MPPKGLLADLRALVGADAVVDDPEVVASRSVDFTGGFVGRSDLLLRPSTDVEVASLLRYASNNSLALVPQGGNTSLVAGATPFDGEAILDLRRLCGITVAGETLRCSAGESVAALRALADDVGLRFGLDLASRDSATAGGIVSTDAAGLGSVRFGRAGDLLEELRFVAGTGEIAHLSGEALAQVVGSEGTLGVVVDVAFRLFEKPESFVSYLVVVESGTQARTIVESLGAEGLIGVDGPIEALEVFDYESAQLSSLVHGVSLPQVGGAYVLCEVSSQAEQVGAILAEHAGESVFFAELTHFGGGAFWKLREGISSAVASLGLVHKFDLTVPVCGLDVLLDVVVPSLRSDFDAHCFVFGHAAIEKLHLNVVCDHSVLDDLRFRLITWLDSNGGSFVGEHGSGRLKSDFLSKRLGPDDHARWRAIKSRFDPAGIMNPMVIPAATLRT